MRYGIFGDVHGNLEALDTVLNALSKEKIDRYLCVGDIIGYGADPLSCIDKVKTVTGNIVSGNHEAASTGVFCVDYFNPYAKAAVLWTRESLRDEDTNFLKGLPTVFENDDLVMVHGSLNEPGKFNYIFSPLDSKETFQLLNKTICFIGHTHSPQILVERDVIISQVYGHKAEINPEYKYVVNVGSVGQPRDGDVRAAYCIYNISSQTVQIKRVSYDIKSAQRKIIDVGLPQFLAERLSAGR